MAYGAPADVQSIYDRLTPEQIQQIASGIGFSGDPNTSAYNAFVSQDPSRFEAAVRGIYSAPQQVQSAYDALNPQQQTQLANSVGYSGTGQDSAFNSFIAGNPEARNAFESGAVNFNVKGFEPPGWTGYADPLVDSGAQVFPIKPEAAAQPAAAASNRYAAPQWAQGVWDQLKPYQQTQVANQLGYSGTGQQSAFNDYVVQNNKGADFETMLGRINPETFGQPMGRPQAPQGAQSYGYDTGFGYGYPSAFGQGGYGSTFGAFGQQPMGQTTNYLASTPTAQAPQGSAFNAGHDYGVSARGSFQFKRGGRI